MKRRLIAALAVLAAVLAPAAGVLAKGFDARPPAEVLEAYARAQRELTADERDAARRSVEWVLEKAPDFGAAYGLYKETFNGNPDGRKAAADKYRKLTVAEPDRAAYWYALARLGVDVDERRAAVERVLKLDPESPWGHYGAGLVGELTSDKAAAVAGYEKAYAVSPDEPSIAMALAAVYAEAERLADAAKILDALVTKAPASYWTEELFAYVVTSESGAAQQARAKRYLDLFPRGRYSVMAHRMVLDDLASRDKAAAAAAAKQAIATLSGARYAGGRGRLYQEFVLAPAVEAGQPAIDKLATELLASKEDSPNVYLAIAEYYSSEKTDAKLGVQLLTRGYEAALASKAGVDVTDNLRYGLGRMYVRTGEPRRAVEYLSAVTTEELMPSTGFALGEVHEKLGEPAKAVDAYITSVAAEPTPARLARLMATAKTAGKSDADTNAAVWAAREKRAKPSTPFTLKSLDGKDVSLADFRGKAVLLNFWFPG